MKQKQISGTFRHELHKQILKICHSVCLPLHCNKKGPKRFTEHQRIGLIILFQRSRLSLREFVRRLPEQKWISWLDLKQLPSKSTLHSWLERIPEKIIRLFNAIILRKEKPSLMAIDATGIDSWKRSRHYERRIGESYMPYAKLDVFVDVKSKLIHDHILRVKTRHDTLGATSIFKRTKLKGVKILGDKGYDSEPLHRIAVQNGNKLYAPVRNFSRKRPKGFNRKRCLKKDEDYPLRNNVESTIKSLKAVRVSALKCKKHFMKKREMAWHILIYNLEKINILSKLFEWLFKQPFWTQPSCVLSRNWGTPQN